MEKISYGSVDLECIRTNFVNRENVYTDDGTSSLYTKWTIDVLCRFAPNDNYTAYKTQANNPVQDNTSLPGLTDNAIRQYLMQPRRRLVVQAGGATIIDVPEQNVRARAGYYLTDAKNGPFCNVQGIVQIIGMTHFLVHCVFVAHVSELGLASTDSQKVILSNRWTASEDIDEFGYPVRTFDGEAVLRTDFMWYRNSLNLAGNPAANFNADSIRPQFLFPVPDNYMRKNVSVELSSDGSRLKWSFQDVAMPYNFGPDSPIRKIEAFQDFDVAAGNPARALAGLTRTFVRGNFWGALWQIARLRGGDASEVTNAYGSNLPAYSNRVQVDMWGNRSTPRKQLRDLALGFCFKQLNFDNKYYTLATSRIKVREAMAEKFVSVDWTMEFSDDFRTGAIAGATERPFRDGSFVSNFPSVVLGVDHIFGTVYTGTTIPVDQQLGAATVDPNDKTKDGPILTILDQRANGIKRNPSYLSDCYSSVSALIVPLVTQVLQNPNQSLPRPSIPIG